MLLLTAPFAAPFARSCCAVPPPHPPAPAVGHSPAFDGDGGWFGGSLHRPHEAAGTCGVVLPYPGVLLCPPPPLSHRRRGDVGPPHGNGPSNSVFSLSSPLLLTLLCLSHPWGTQGAGKSPPPPTLRSAFGASPHPTALPTSVPLHCERGAEGGGGGQDRGAPTGRAEPPATTCTQPRCEPGRGEVPKALPWGWGCFAPQNAWGGSAVRAVGLPGGEGRAWLPLVAVPRWPGRGRPRCPRGAIAASQRRAGAEPSHGAACPAPDSRCAGAPPRPDAALRLQEELTSTSVEHLIINPNAAFEKFKDKRLGTDGVGERRPGGGQGGQGGLSLTSVRSCRFLRPHQQEQNDRL